MELAPFFRSVLEQDDAPVVLCDLAHTIIYMNPSAVLRYQRQGGAALVGKSLLNCHNEESKQIIEKVISWFGESEKNNMIHSFYNEKENKDGYMVALRDENGMLIGYYEKHEYRDREEAPFYDFSKSLV